MKSVTKFKFLHIGLKYWQLIVDKINSFDTKLQAREKLTEHLVTSNFVKILVKNIQSQKNQLHDQALAVKQSLITFITQSKLSGDLSLKLVIQLFGPNSNLRFSVKKNLDLLKALTLRFEEAQVTQYLDYLKGLLESQPLNDHFPQVVGDEQEDKKQEEKNGDDEDEEEKDSEKQTEMMRRDMIKTFAINQIGNIPQMFRSTINSGHVSSIIDTLVDLTYFSSNPKKGENETDELEQLAQFKLFGLVQMLHKLNLGDAQKGMKND